MIAVAWKQCSHTANLYLVCSDCCHPLLSINRGVESADLLPAGIKGLERAIDRFDASKGFKFSTYAHWWIRQSVSRCVQVSKGSSCLLPCFLPVVVVHGCLVYIVCMCIIMAHQSVVLLLRFGLSSWFCRRIRGWCGCR